MKFQSFRALASVTSAVLLAGQAVSAIEIDINNRGQSRHDWRKPALGATADLKNPWLDSIKTAAATAAWGMLQFYTGNRTGDIPGNLPQPYYWWEAGAMMGSLIDYYYFTGDSQYNSLVTQGMLHQVGPNNDYMPPNQTKTEVCLSLKKSTSSYLPKCAV
jgi:hypothetical protein